MQQSLRTLCLFAALSCALVMVSANCNQCQTNNVACINETHFHLCFDNIVQDNDALDCGEGRVCTNLGIVCFEEGIRAPSCIPTGADEPKCRTCDGNSLFVCTSRTTFQMCRGDTLSTEVSTCPENKVCSIDSGKFCVDECDLPGAIECDTVAP